MLPCEICSYCNSSPFVGNLYFSPTLHVCRISLFPGFWAFSVVYLGVGLFLFTWDFLWPFSIWKLRSFISGKTNWIIFLIISFLSLSLFPLSATPVFFRFWTSWAGSLIFFYLWYLFLLPSISVLYPIFWGGFLNFIFQLFYWVLHFRCHLLISNSFCCCCYSLDEYFFLKRSPAKTCFFPVAFYLFVSACLSLLDALL